MATDTRDFKTVVNTTVPTGQRGGLERAGNVDAYGNTLVRALGAKNHMLAKMGAYYTVKTVQTTGVAGHADAVAYDATKCTIHMANTSTVTSTDAGGKYVYIDYLKWTVIAAGTGATDHLYSVAVDTAGSAVSSGGTAYVPLNVGLLSSETSGLTVTMGAVVAAAASTSKRILYQGTIRTAKPVVGDRVVFGFGGNEVNTPSGLLSTSTGQAMFVETLGPWIIPPACNGLFHLHSASESAAKTLDIEVGFWVL